MSKRVLKECAASVRSISADGLDTPAQLKTWLEAQAKVYDCTTLLAHAEDGVTWGRFDVTPDKTTLLTGFEAEGGGTQCYSAALNPDTLWQARLFGGHAEVLVWREQGVLNATWQARVIEDKAQVNVLYCQCFDEGQLLLGSEGAPVGETGFTRMREGSAELVHVLPILVQKVDRQHRVRLMVRHYLAQGEPLARVAATRLVGITKEVG